MTISWDETWTGEAIIRKTACTRQALAGNRQSNPYIRNFRFYNGHIWPLANYDPFRVAVTDLTENAFMLILFKYQDDAGVYMVFESWHSN